MTKILGICGSLRDNSVSKKMVERILQSAQQEGAQVELLELGRYTIPFADGRMNNDSSYGPVVDELRKKVREADGFIIGTPEYHGGYSGSLKNFLDLNCAQDFKNKLVGLVGAAGGRLGAEAALNQLRIVFKNLEAICFPTQTTVGGQDVNKQGVITNDIALQRLNKMGKEFVDLLKRLNPVNPNAQAS